MELYQSIFKSLPLTTFLCDRKKKIINLINPTSLSIRNCHPEKYCGRNITELLALPDFPLHNILLKFDAAFDEILQTGENRQFEYEFEDEYFIAGGVLLGDEYVIFHLCNITIVVRKRINEELCRSKYKAELTLLKNHETLNQLILQNEMILNNTNSGLAYITTDFVVQWENISFCSGNLSHEAYRKGEFCYRTARGRDTPCEDCVMRRALESRQMEQITFTFSNGKIVEVFATPVLRDDGTMDGIVIRVDNVTERERMIKELKNAKVLAEQSDKLKSAFLANMSHEIRTPLNAIVGFSGLLAETLSDEEKEEYLKIIRINNELLLKLISDILDLSKIESGAVELNYEDFDLSVYFDDMAVSMQQRVTNPDVHLIVSNPWQTCNVSLDLIRVAQIMTNYVTNAIKYTPKGFIEMGYDTTDEGIRLYVKDSGIGIPEDKKNKVFHRFEKLDEFAQGTGLGLSICKAITESMGGSVGYESQYGVGSYFWAILPCSVDTGEDMKSRVVHTPLGGPERHPARNC